MKYKLFLLSVLLVVAASLISCNLLSSKPRREVWGEGGLRRELWVSQERASVGDSIDIVFTVKNVSDETQVIEIDDGPVMDIVVGQGSSYQREAWWSDVNEFTPEMSRLELDPGESRTIEMTWVPIGRTDGGNVSDARVAGLLYTVTPRGEKERIPISLKICVEMCDEIGI